MVLEARKSKKKTPSDSAFWFIESTFLPVVFLYNRKGEGTLSDLFHKVINLIYKSFALIT